MACPNGDSFASALIDTQEDRRCGLCQSNGQLGDEHPYQHHMEAVLADGERYEIVTDRFVDMFPLGLDQPPWRKGMEAMLAWITDEGYQAVAMRRTRVAPCGTLCS